MRTKAFGSVAVVVILSCALLGYTSASDSPAGGLLALTPRITMTPTDDPFTSPLPTPTPTHDPFTSPLPTPTWPCTNTALPPPAPTTTPPYPYTATPSPSPTVTPTRDPFTSPLPTPVAWPSSTPQSAFTPSPTPTGTSAPTYTPSPTPTRFCPLPTAEPLWVDPLLSPTDRLSQTIVVYAGNSEAITVTTESGLFAAPGSLGAHVPVLVDVDLLPNTIHHLRVYSRVRLIEAGECVYGGYTLSTTTDRYGDPLTIVQRTGGQAAHTVWLPLVLKNHVLLVPSAPRSPVDRECLPPAECAY